MRLVVPVLLFCGASHAQTPPIRPNTPDVPVFPGFVVPLGGVNQEIGREPLTAEEAVQIALRLQPALLSDFQAMRAARARADQSRAALVPQFSIGYNASDVQIVRGSEFSGSAGTGFRSSGSVSVTQLLFDFGRARSLVRQQSSFARVAEHDYSQSQMDVAVSVRRAFYGHRQSLRLQEVSESNLATRRSQLALADARLNSGLGAPADLLRAKNAVAEATLALTSARTAAVASRMGLALSIGVDPRTPIALAESSEDAPGEDVEALIGSALSQRPEILSATAEVAANRHGLSFARSSNSPTLNFVASLNSRGGNDPLRDQTSSVGIGFNWPIGDGGLGAGRAREARAGLAGAEARLVQVTQSVVAEVVQASVELEAAEQRLTVALIQVQNAKELVRISEGRYSGGIGQFLEVTDAQDALFSAERNLANAEAGVQVARAALRRAIGQS